MAFNPSDRIQSTLDLLILKTLSWGPAHGYAIARWIQHSTEDVFKVGEGTLYPALHRLESRGAVLSEWQVAESGRRARMYSLTPAGRLQLSADQQTFLTFAEAVTRMLTRTEQPT